MIKRMLIMLAGALLVFGGIFSFKIIGFKKFQTAMAAMAAPAVTVSATNAALLPWQPQVNAVGSLRAARGVDVTSEVTGLVRSVAIRSGNEVGAGALLVQLNSDSDVALLHSLEAAADLAATVYERDKGQFEIQAISKAALDADSADLKSKRAQVDQQAALVAKKSIRAPFAGRLGITTIQPGQYLNPGDKIVTLQQIDYLLADFYLPQQLISQLAIGQRVSIVSDSYPGRTFEGKVTALDPRVDPATRNIQVEATIANSKRELLPGMYVSASVDTGAAQPRLTLPQTAITFNPYGSTVYVVQAAKGPDGQPRLTAQQRFVTTGETRGDQVTVLSGLSAGDEVVSSGQLKLKNGSTIVISNKVQPSDNPAPRPVDR